MKTHTKTKATTITALNNKARVLWMTALSFLLMVTIIIFAMSSAQAASKAAEAGADAHAKYTVKIVILVRVNVKHVIRRFMKSGVVLVMPMQVFHLCFISLNKKSQNSLQP